MQPGTPKTWASPCASDGPQVPPVVTCVSVVKPGLGSCCAMQMGLPWLTNGNAMFMKSGPIWHSMTSIGLGCAGRSDHGTSPGSAWVVHVIGTVREAHLLASL